MELNPGAFASIDRPLYSFQACREIDQHSIAAGLPEQQLMGQAALASLHALQPRAGQFRRYLILCGPGNNGGDGYALAFHLAGTAHCPPVQIFATAAPRSPAARFYAGLVSQYCQAQVSVHPAEDFRTVALQAGDCVIEALLGTGQDDNLRGTIAELNEQICAGIAARRADDNTGGPYFVSLDLPPGINESSGAAQTHLFVPDEVHCYGVDKLALRLAPPLHDENKTQIRILPIGFLPDPAILREHELSGPAAASLVAVVACGF